MSEAALIALGANLGDPERALQNAAAIIVHWGVIVAASSIYRTAPVGGPPGQPDYRNAVLALRTELSPEELLGRLLETEREQGRVRRERWGPRVLDLDLLSYGDRVLETPSLMLPHPRLMERAFVLAPLAEIAPDWRHPITGQTAGDVLGQVTAEGVIRTETGLFCPTAAALTPVECRPHLGEGGRRNIPL